MYSEKIMEIFEKQENMGEIRSANAIGEAGSAYNGDILKFYMVVEKEKIVDAKCKAFGSAVTIAVGSVCAKKLVGKTLDKALEMDIFALCEDLRVPEEKKSCLVSAKEAIAAAVNYYYKKQEKAQKEEIN